MTNSAPNTKISPLQMGFASAVALLFGMVSLEVLIDNIPIALWALCVLPVVAGLVVQFLVARECWIYRFYSAIFAFNAFTFAVVLWYASYLGSGGNRLLIPIVLVASAYLGGLLGGYQVAKNSHTRQSEKARRTSPNHNKAASPNTVDRWRNSSSGIERILSQIRALTPLLIALGLNSAYLFSQETIYWFSGTIGLILTLLFAYGSGGACFRSSVTT